jgi:hypothetical protein
MVASCYQIASKLLARCYHSKLGYKYGLNSTVNRSFGECVQWIRRTTVARLITVQLQEITRSLQVITPCSKPFLAILFLLLIKNTNITKVWSPLDRYPWLPWIDIKLSKYTTADWNNCLYSIIAFITVGCSSRIILHSLIYILPLVYKSTTPRLSLPKHLTLVLSLNAQNRTAWCRL